jgi:hypothetical protein
MGRSRRLVALSTALAAVAVAGCGTTVDTGRSPAAGVGAPGSQALSVPSSGASGLTSPGGAVPGGVAGGSAAAGAAGSTAGAGAGTSTGGAIAGPGAASGLVGPGITKTTIYLGMPYSSQEASGDRAAGASGAAPSYDFRNVVNAVIDYADKHGGFAGRKMQALYYNYNLTTDQSVQDQSACSYWTQDHKTFVIPASSDILKACAEKEGGISLVGGGDVASTFQRFPHFVDPIGMRLDRLGPVTTNGLSHAGYFAGKLGFVTWDDPNYRFAYTNGYLPALTARGIKVTDKAFISVPQQIGALGAMSAAVSSAVTKFRSEGIDHVIIQDGRAGVWTGAGLTLEWMNQAESQKYYPRYGQNTYNAPGWSGLPSDQMDKAIAIMDNDSDPSYDAGWRPNKTREQCFKIEADAGFPVSTSNLNDESLAAQACDMVFFIQFVINRLGSSLTSNAFVQEVAALGRSFPTATVYGTQFARGLRDGSAEVRQAEYFASCKCLKYAGAPYYPG